MENNMNIKIGSLSYDKEFISEISTDDIMALKEFYYSLSNSMFSMISIDLLIRDKKLSSDEKINLISTDVSSAFKFQELYHKYKNTYLFKDIII